jgi:hypothetical protein
MAKPPVPQPAAPAAKGDPAREQRLAQALRANLKRRKAAAAPAVPDKRK